MAGHLDLSEFIDELTQGQLEHTILLVFNSHATLDNKGVGGGKETTARSFSLEDVESDNFKSSDEDKAIDMPPRAIESSPLCVFMFSVLGQPLSGNMGWLEATPPVFFQHCRDAEVPLHGRLHQSIGCHRRPHDVSRCHVRSSCQIWYWQYPEVPLKHATVRECTADDSFGCTEPRP